MLSAYIARRDEDGDYRKDIAADLINKGFELIAEAYGVETFVAMMADVLKSGVGRMRAVEKRLLGGVN